MKLNIYRDGSKKPLEIGYFLVNFYFGEIVCDREIGGFVVYLKYGH